MSEKTILFLCTGNSCRSQMAEGLANAFLAPEWRAFSAGTRPSGYVHPLAIRAMADVGIDVSAQRSRSTEALRGQQFDLVITVCDSAAEDCPVWLGQGRVLHIAFPDPAEAEGTEAERLAVFAQVRDDIHRRIVEPLAAGQLA